LAVASSAGSLRLSFFAGKEKKKRTRGKGKGKERGNGKGGKLDCSVASRVKGKEDRYSEVHRKPLSRPRPWPKKRGPTSPRPKRQRKINAREIPRVPGRAPPAR